LHHVGVRPGKNDADLAAGEVGVTMAAARNDRECANTPLHLKKSHLAAPFFGASNVAVSASLRPPRLGFGDDISMYVP
jgi:hypothetical protein